MFPSLLSWWPIVCILDMLSIFLSCFHCWSWWHVKHPCDEKGLGEFYYCKFFIWYTSTWLLDMTYLYIYNTWNYDSKYTEHEYDIRMRIVNSSLGLPYYTSYRSCFFRAASCVSPRIWGQCFRQGRVPRRENTRRPTLRYLHGSAMMTQLIITEMIEMMQIHLEPKFGAPWFLEEG